MTLQNYSKTLMNWQIKWINVLRLTALLFGDLRHMKWQDVDFNESKWRFQPIKGKGKENMVKEMIVPLPTQAIEILKQQ